MIKINIKTPKRTLESMQAVGCKKDSIKRTDDIEKNKKTKKNEPVRTIVQTSKCKLKNVNSPRQRVNKKLTGSNSKDRIQVNKQKLDRLLAASMAAVDDPKQEIDLDALKRLLGVEADSIEEALQNAIRNRLGKDKHMPEAMDNFQKARRKKELNKKYNDQRSKMERDLPLSAINKDFMSLASGVAESTESDASGVRRALATLRAFFDKKYEGRTDTDVFKEETKKKK